jgi:hypothetical protein
VKQFRSAVDSFFRDHRIDTGIIRKRAERGDYASRGMSFKLEGLIQLTDCCSVDFLAPQTITAFLRKHPVDIPNCFYAYQKDAFETAYVYSMQMQI